jgi:hypothetical protein
MKKVVVTKGDRRLKITHKGKMWECLDCGQHNDNSTKICIRCGKPFQNAIDTLSDEFGRIRIDDAIKLVMVAKNWSERRTRREFEKWFEEEKIAIYPASVDTKQ